MRTDDQRNHDQIAKVRELLDAGKSGAEAARALQLTPQRVSRIIKDYLPASYAGRKGKAAIHSGKTAKPGGKLRRGKLQVVCYPGPKTKPVLVSLAKKAKLPLANYLVISGLERGEATGRIPVAELNKLLRV
jgi:hypothetical protein